MNLTSFQAIIPRVEILALGDIFGRPGRNAVKTHLPALKKIHNPDLTLANAENLSGGKGFLAQHIDEMRAAGIDFFTSGNHVWRQRESIPKLDNPGFPMIRPANYHESCPGRGYDIVKTRTNKKVLVINLMGQVFMPNQLDSPFHCVDAILAAVNATANGGSGKINAIVIDFHAEVTSEKWALGNYLDSRVSLVYGTHTHVPTADCRILPKGTAFITDVGMTGPYDSIIGLEKDAIINNFLTQMPPKHDVASGDPRFNAILVEIDENTLRASSITLIQKP